MNALRKLHIRRALRRTQTHTSFGFTAVELMVVIAILSILIALAAPSFKLVIERWRVRDAREAMISTLFLARSEAIKRGGNVEIQRLPITDCSWASANDWSCGWQVVFTDAAGATTAIQSFPAPRSLNVTVATSAIGSVTSLKFDRWGVAVDTAGAAVAPRVLISPYPDGVAAFATSTLCVNGGGRMQSLQGDATCS